MKTRAMIGSVGTLLAVGTAAGQSFNIDFGPIDNQTPGASYGGGATQSGPWNAVNKLLIDLVATDGSLTAVRIGSNRMTTGFAPFDGASDEEAALMEDFGFGNAMDTGANYQVIGLEPGWYDFYIYAWAGMSPGYTESIVTLGVLGDVHTHFTSVWPGKHVEGETYGKLTIEVTEPNSNIGMGLVPLGGELDPVSVINGLQIVQIPAPAAGLPLLVGCALMRRRRS